MRVFTKFRIYGLDRYKQQWQWKIVDGYECWMVYSQLNPQIQIKNASKSTCVENSDAKRKIKMNRCPAETSYESKEINIIS